MRLTRQIFFLNHRRIRNVMDHLGSSLDDETITLDTLAEVACLSRYHFERLYAAKVLETPMATVRRLRLMRARQSLQSGYAGSLTDLALQSGYGSIAAFSRAYSRAYGNAPSLEMPSLLPVSQPDKHPELHIVELLPRRAVCLPFWGMAGDLSDAGNDLAWRVAVSGAQRWRHWTLFQEGVAGIDCRSDAWIRAWHYVPADTLPPNVPGVDWGWLPGGRYARFAFIGSELWGLERLAARVAAETPWTVIDGPVLINAPKVNNFTPPSERIVHLYLPVALQ